MGRTLAIGDIHGCYTAFRTLCDTVNLRADDTIVTLGDYPNRGPNTRAVIDWLLHLDETHNLVPIRGNHDIMMLRARAGDKEDYRSWMGVGGNKTLASYSRPDSEGELADIPEAHWEFFESRLQPYYETTTHFFVHANAYPDMPLAEQPDLMLYWEKFRDPPPHESGKIMVCGHSSQKSGLPINIGHAICIDTRAFKNGWLTCLDVDSGEMWQANQQAETRQLWLDEVAKP